MQNSIIFFLLFYIVQGHAASVPQCQFSLEETEKNLNELDNEIMGKIIDLGDNPEALGFVNTLKNVHMGDIPAIKSFLKEKVLEKLLNGSEALSTPSIIYFEKGKRNFTLFSLDKKIGLAEIEIEGRRYKIRSSKLAKADSSEAFHPYRSNGKSMDVILTESGVVKKIEETPQFLSQAHRNDVVTIISSPDKRFFVTVDKNPSLFIWDSKTKKLIGKIKSEHNLKELKNIIVSPDSEEILLLSDVYGMERYSATTGKKIAEIKNQKNMWLKSMNISADGKYYLAVEENMKKNAEVVVFEIKTGKEVKRFKPGSGKYTDATLSPSGDKIITFGDQEDKVLLWDIATGKSSPVVVTDPKKIMAMNFTPDGKNIIIEVKYTKLEIRSIYGTSPPIEIEASSRRLGQFDYSADKKSILVTGKNDNVQLISLVDGKTKMSFGPHPVFVEKYNMSPDGSKVFTFNRNSIRVWDAQTGVLLKEIQTSSENFKSIEFSPDGLQIIAGEAYGFGSEKASVKIYDINAYEIK